MEFRLILPLKSSFRQVWHVRNQNSRSRVDRINGRVKVVVWSAGPVLQTREVPLIKDDCIGDQSLPDVRIVEDPARLICWVANEDALLSMRG